MAGNRIAMLRSADFSQLVGLRYLNLRNNDIGQLDGNSFILIRNSLSYLDLSWNKIHSLQGCVRFHSVLLYLNLEDNRIEVNIFSNFKIHFKSPIIRVSSDAHSSKRATLASQTWCMNNFDTRMRIKDKCCNINEILKTNLKV
ncbi:hypothetical protein CEXT_321071 [Caerostris extrusa]|uniref:Uncharacterized protein n=1 Tax=Caerostris extrusa TaxID=172846 RepID=A0AAV4NR90_CAEEX|nr:hypothetical protein CEXT_321071 [Caerostris extrusa]